jgi:hypothetical protein
LRQVRSEEVRINLERRGRKGEKCGRGINGKNKGEEVSEMGNWGKTRQEQARYER